MTCLSLGGDPSNRRCAGAEERGKGSDILSQKIFKEKREKREISK